MVWKAGGSWELLVTCFYFALKLESELSFPSKIV